MSRKERVKVFVNQSNLVVKTMADIDNVDLTANANGAILIYDSSTEKFKASTTLDAQIIDGGTY
jgi:hypothetical protein